MPRLLTPVIFIISVILTILVTVLCSIPITLAGIVKLPGAHSRRLAIYLGFRRFHDVVLVPRAGAVIAH